VNFYNDSLVNDELAIYFRDQVDGIILDREIGYRLKVPKIIEHTTTITKPQPVIQKGADRTGMYYGGGIGFAREGVAGTFGISYLTKKNMMFGAEYLHTESKGYILFNMKLKIN
jgi:hypothetical protein